MDNFKICPQCKMQSAVSAKFCGQCGYLFPVNAAPANEMPGAPTNAAPVNGMPGAPVNAAPVNEMPGAPTNAATNPPEPKKKGNGPLIGILIGIGVLIVGVVVALLGIFLGWFGGPKNIELSETKIRFEEDEEYVVTINNYDELRNPEFTFTMDKNRIVEVVDNGDGTLTFTGLSDGKVNVTISAKRCEDAVVKVTIDEKVVAPDFDDEDLAQTAWSSGVFDYYFCEDGTFYAISDSNDDYMKGTYSATVISASEALSKFGTNLDSYVEDVEKTVYLDITCDITEEIWDGSVFNNSGYHMLFAMDASNTAIYTEDSEIEYEISETTFDTEGLDDYFSETPSTADDPVTPSSGGVDGVYFNPQRASVKESWHVSRHEDDLILEYNGDLYIWNISMVGTGTTPELLKDFGDEEVTVFAVYNDYLVYGIGSGSATYEMWVKDLTGAASDYMLTDSFDCRDFIIFEDYIYMTDYSQIQRVDFNGNMDLVWDYGVYAFEVDYNYIYVFDGNSWEILDISTFEDYGYVLSGVGGSYEVDIIHADDGYLFYTKYDEYNNEIALYCLDEDSNERLIGSAHYGESYDTYNAAYVEEFAIYTIEGAETLVSVNVTTGDENEIALGDYGYYYTPEIALVDGDVICFIVTNDGRQIYAVFDYLNQELVEIPELCFD